MQGKLERSLEGRIASLRLRDPEKERLWFAGTAGEGWTPALIQTIYRLDEPSIARQVLTTKRLCIIPDTDTKPEMHVTRLFSWIRAYIAIPVFDRRQEVIGILSVNDDHPRDFSMGEDPFFRTHSAHNSSGSGTSGVYPSFLYRTLLLSLFETGS